MGEFAVVDGIRTRYEISGKGPIPLLMLAPSAFDASIERWRVTGAWKPVQPLDTLGDHFTMIAYDRREAGQSGGRIEPLSWDLYTRHAKGLLDHLGIAGAVLLGGCMGCSVAAAFAAAYPQATRGLLLHWPVGGYRWLLKARGQFDLHAAYVREHGLAGAAERAAASGMFWNDPQAGPWSAPIANDPTFRRAFEAQDVEQYLAVVEASKLQLFPDTLPSGTTAPQLLALKTPTFIMSGDDAAHSASSAQALRELIAGAQLAPQMPPAQSPEVLRDWVIASGQAAWEASA